MPSLFPPSLFVAEKRVVSSVFTKLALLESVVLKVCERMCGRELGATRTVL